MIALSSGSKTPGRVSEADRPTIIYERSSTIPWGSSTRKESRREKNARSKESASKENASKTVDDVDGTPKGPSRFKRNIDSLVRDIYIFFFPFILVPHAQILLSHNEFIFFVCCFFVCEC